MAMVPEYYGTPTGYRQAIGKTTTGTDNDIVRGLRTVAQILDSRMDRTFARDDTDTTRTFTVSRYAPYHVFSVYTPQSALLPIDDLSAPPTSITVDGATLSPSDYALVLDSPQLRREPRPYVAVQRVSGWWPRGGTVAITGRWGWPAVPAAVIEEAYRLLAILRVESPLATNRISEVDGSTVSASPMAFGLTKQLMELYGRSWVLV